MVISSYKVATFFRHFFNISFDNIILEVIILKEILKLLD